MIQVEEEFVVIKGKRTKRSRPPSPLLETMITNNTMIPSPRSNDVATTTTTTTSSEHELRDKTELLEDDEDMAYCLILLAKGHDHAHKASSTPPPLSSKHDDDHNNNKYLFQCKTCDRCFPSFQALGGHRASHNKPNNNNKLPNNSSFVSDSINHGHDHCDPNTTRSTILSLQASSKSNRPNDFYGTSITSSTTSTKKIGTTKAKSHLCSTCGAEFSSGQALGGHMRRHRNFLSTSSTTTSSSMSGTESREAKKPRNNNNNVLKLDLNLPAPLEDDDHNQRDQSSKFSFQTNEKVIVFSTASSLVDCQY